MSSAPTDCRVPATPDPADKLDAKADGNFGNHRAGYGSDRLQRAEAWARKGYTLAAGEGLVLCAEIDRLRSRKIDREDLPNALREENNRLRKELEIATSMLGEQVPLLNRLQDENDWLRGELRDTHTKVFHLEEKLAWTERERDQLTSMPAERILAALREPSEAVIVECAKALRQHHEGVTWCTWEDLKEQTRQRMMDEVLVVLSSAVAAAEKEASDDPR